MPPAAVERGSDRQEAPRSLTDAVAAVSVLQADSPILEFRHLAEPRGAGLCLKTFTILFR